MAFFSLLAPSDALAGRIAAREINTVRTVSFISSGVPKVELTKLVNCDSARTFNGFAEEFLALILERSLLVLRFISDWAENGDRAYSSSEYAGHDDFDCRHRIIL